MSHRCETHIITIGTEQSKASICLTGASATTHSNMVIKVYIATSSGSTSVRTERLLHFSYDLQGSGVLVMMVYYMSGVWYREGRLPQL